MPMVIRPQPLQPKTTSKPKPAPPAAEGPVPVFILEGAESTSLDPTLPPPGSSGHPRDAVQWLEGTAHQEELLKGDFTAWAALDGILGEIVRSNPGTSKLSDAERVRKARAILVGARLGRKPEDDSGLLRKIAAEYFREYLKSGEHTKLQPLITAAIDPESWTKSNEEKQAVLHKRISRAFNRDKDRLLLETFAYDHPLQRRRWQAVQEIIRLLQELRIVSEPPPK